MHPKFHQYNEFVLQMHCLSESSLYIKRAKLSSCYLIFYLIVSIQLLIHSTRLSSYRIDHGHIQRHHFQISE